MERITIKDTISASAVISVTPGYFHSNENRIDLTSFGVLYQEVADEIFAKTNMYCGGIITPCKTLYSTHWGCPKGGENGVYITADCNPFYDKERTVAEFIELWKDTFVSIIELLMYKLNQTTVTVTFSDGELVYLNNKKA